MNEIYGIGQANYYNSLTGTAAQKKEKTSDTEKQSEKVDTYEKGDAIGVVKKKKQQTKLSAAASELLRKLKEKYKDTDFIVADYDNDEEAEKYLSQGQKEYSVLIEPELLEEMAADEDTKEKYEGIIEDSKNQLSEAKEQLGEDADKVKTLGITIDAKGTLMYFAELEKVSEAQKERIEQAREDKKISHKSVRVEASSTQELLQKIRDAKLEDEQGTDVGGTIDFTV